MLRTLNHSDRVYWRFIGRSASFFRCWTYLYSGRPGWRAGRCRGCCLCTCDCSVPVAYRIAGLSGRFCRRGGTGTQSVSLAVAGSSDWWLLIAVGLISSIAQWIGVTAYKLAEANVVANVEYAKIVYSVIIGYWLFEETLGVLAFCGVVLIVSSALLPMFYKYLSLRHVNAG